MLRRRFIAHAAWPGLSHPGSRRRWRLWAMFSWLCWGGAGKLAESRSDLTPPSGDRAGFGRLLVAHPLRDGFGGHRSAEPVALHEVHARRVEEALLVGLLDALGDHLEAERPPDADHRMDDGGVDRHADIADEGAIDLDLPERKAPQVIEARIAGAEIVEREGHAEPLQPLHHPRDRILGFQQGGFGD